MDENTNNYKVQVYADLTIEKLLELEEWEQIKLGSILNCLKPKPVHNGKRIISWEELTFDTIIKIKQASNIYEVASIWLDIDIENLIKLNLIELHYSINYIKVQIEDMRIKEESIPTSQTIEETAAGIDELKPFADLSLAEKIARDWNIEISKVFELPYVEVFTKKLYDANLARYENKLRKIHQNKNKKA